MEYSRVSSGYTKVIDEQRRDWYEKLGEEKLEWEDLAGAESTNDLLRMLGNVPLYRYLVNYLLSVWEGKDLEEIPFETAVSELTERVSKAFRANGMPEKKCSEVYVRSMLSTEWSRKWDSFEKKASARIFELGLGLGLPAQDVEMLLQKAAKRAGFNYYDSEELAVYCALQFCKENHYRCCQALRRDYEKIASDKQAEGEVVFSSTTEVRDQIVEAVEKSVWEKGVYSTKDFSPGTMNPELEQFFAKHKAAAVKTRTAAVVFMELLKKFIKEHRGSILAFKQTERVAEEYAETVLKVEYDARHEIMLPKGSVFYAVKHENKQERHVRFILEEAAALPQREAIEVVIPVRGIQPYAVCAEKKKTPGYAGKGTELNPDENAARAGVLSARTDTTLRYSGNPGEEKYAEGNIRAVCLPGTEIPEGTVFSADGYTYKTLKSCKAYASEMIGVRAMEPSKKGKKLAETGEVRYMENEPEGILSISNSKPVYRKEMLDKDGISIALFRDFLYVKDAQRMDKNERNIDSSLLGPWFTETEITDTRFTNIQKQAGEKDPMERKKMQHSEVRRCDIITLVFLNFCMDEDFQPIEEQVVEENAEYVYQDFVLEVNKYLRKCGMMPFYLQNPYECLLAYLIQTDSPAESLRNMWKIVSARKEGVDD